MGITALIALTVSGVSASLAGAWRLVLVIRTPKVQLVDAAREMQGTRFSVRLGQFGAIQVDPDPSQPSTPTNPLQSPAAGASAPQQARPEQSG
jgi:hypothetical protein